MIETCRANSCQITRGTSARTLCTKSTITYRPKISISTCKAVTNISAGGTACVTWVAKIINLVVTIPTFRAKSIGINFKAAITQNAPTSKQKRVHTDHTSTISASENCSLFTWTAARTLTINSAPDSLRTLNALTFIKSVTIDTWITSVLNFTDTV